MKRRNLPRFLFGKRDPTRKTKLYDEPFAPPEVLHPAFDEGNDDTDAIRASLGVSDKRRPASE